MKKTLENDLQAWYGQFEKNHDQRREQLISSLSQFDTAGNVSGHTNVKAGRLGMPYAAKATLALAAGLMIVLGLLIVFNGSDTTTTVVSPQMAWASAIDQARRVQSVHFRLSTPGGSADATVEMWWRRPHDFRMELDQLVMAGNNETMCIWNGSQNTLTLRNAGVGGSGPEMFILGNLGRLFISEDDALYQEWIDSNEIVSSELVDYKGQTCRKIKCLYDGHYYEYIIEVQAENDTVRPFLEVKEYRDIEMVRLMSHMEVLAVDEEMPDSLFVIEPQAGQKVVDRREK
jgi:outer membrane lipoprotein-sorting protein